MDDGDELEAAAGHVQTCPSCALKFPGVTGILVRQGAGYPQFLCSPDCLAKWSAGIAGLSLTTNLVACIVAVCDAMDNGALGDYGVRHLLDASIRSAHRDMRGQHRRRRGGVCDCLACRP